MSNNRQREVIPQDAALVDTMQLKRIQIQGVVTDGPSRLGEVDDLRKLYLRKVGVDRPKQFEDAAHRVLWEIC